MKNSIIYTLVFLALQIIATFAVTTTWALINKSTDFSIMPLIISITLFSVLVITVFLMAKWAEVSLNWLLTLHTSHQRGMAQNAQRTSRG